MPLFIDRYPFRTWTDATRTPPLTTRSVVLPILLTESRLVLPPAGVAVEDWVVDTGNRTEAFAWRHHLSTAGVNPDLRRLGSALTIRTVFGRQLVPVRDAELWLVSNIPALQSTPYRIPLHRGLPFRDVPQIPDPEFERPLLGMRALRTARLRVEIDFDADTISVWTPDPPGP